METLPQGLRVPNGLSELRKQWHHLAPKTMASPRTENNLLFFWWSLVPSLLSLLMSDRERERETERERERKREREREIRERERERSLLTIKDD